MFPFHGIFGQTARLFHSPEFLELREAYMPKARETAPAHTSAGSATSDMAHEREVRAAGRAERAAGASAGSARDAA